TTVTDGERSRRGSDLARRVEIPRPEPAGERLRDVDAPVAGCEADAVRSEERERLLDHTVALGWDVVETAAVDARAPTLPVIGEPHTAHLVDDEVVRPAQGATVALAVQHLDRARLEVDALDPATDEAGRLVRMGRVVDRDANAVHLGPEEAAV